MRSCSEDIKDLLVSDLSGNGFDLFYISIGKEPAEPPNVITLIDTSGYSPMLLYDRNKKYEYPSLQIRVRSNHYTDGWNQINTIKDTLHGRANEIINNSFYSAIYCVNGPFLYDYDKNQRPRFIANFNIQRRYV